jgi:hypothetical protein
LDFQALIYECEDDLRAGRIQHAAARLRPLQIAEIPRPFARTMASLFRRAHLETFALRVTTPLMKGDDPEGPATEPEIIEHAAALIQLGSVNEGSESLRPLDPEKNPEVLYWLAAAHAYRYEFFDAIPLLCRFNESAANTPNLHSGLALLAKAYTFCGDHSAAFNIVKSIEARDAITARVLRAQGHIEQRNFAAAKSESAGIHDAYLMQKWEAIATAFESASTAPLSAFRPRAQEHKDWETVRELDRYELEILFDAEKFHHLLFGTPFAAYRDYVLARLKRKWNEDSYRLGATEAPAFILHTGEFKNHQAAAPSKMVHQLLAALLRDFYRPWSIGALFSELFPDEHFDVFSSPNRVHQLLWRLRKWTEANHLPLELIENNGLYSLHRSDAFAFVVPREGLRVDENILHLRQLQSHFHDKPSFTPREAQVCLNISASSFKRLAQWGLKEQKLQREGASRATVYKLVG